MDQEKVSLATVGGGAAIERFDIALQQVVNNILDVNTDGNICVHLAQPRNADRGVPRGGEGMSDYTPYDAYTMRECIERQDATITRLEAENAVKILADSTKSLLSRAEQAEAKVEKVKVAFDKFCRREIDASQVVMAIEQILK